MQLRALLSWLASGPPEASLAPACKRCLAALHAQAESEPSQQQQQGGEHTKAALRSVVTAWLQRHWPASGSMRPRSLG